MSANPYFPETKFMSYEQRNFQQIFGMDVHLHLVVYRRVLS